MESKENKKNPLGQPMVYDPKIFFILLLISITLLSYFKLSLQIDLWLFLFGVLLPIAIGTWLAIRKPVPSGTAPPWKDESLPALPSWAWTILVLALGFSRFYKWDQIPFWPLMDESQFAFFSTELCEKWKNQLLFGDAQMEPLFIWLLTFYFKIVGISFATFRFFPILMSIVTLATCYLVAQLYFSRSISILLLVLLGFNFWSLVCSRQCLQSDLVPLWQAIAFALLFFSLKKHRSTPRFLNICMGAFLGTGFYLYAVWPALVASIFLAIISQKNVKGPQKTWNCLTILGTMILVALPMITARFSSGGALYIQDLLDFRKIHLYLGAFFFNGFGSAPYGPVWGGLFNPVLGAAFWIGFMECAQWRKTPFVQWMAVSSLLFFAPGGFTQQVELHRTTLLFPLMTLVIALGIQSLVQRNDPKPSRKFLKLSLLVLPAILLDLFHYFVLFQDWKTFSANENHWTSIQVSRAYNDLKNNAQKGGRFLVLDNLNDNFKDRAFEIAVHSFNESFQGPSAKGQPDKIAILTNINYQPFLMKRFPRSSWIWLSSDLPDFNGGLMLGWIPYDLSSHKTLDRWETADHKFKEIRNIAPFLPPHSSLKTVIDQLLSEESRWADDPFLRAQWAEWVAYFSLRDPRSNLNTAIRSMEKAASTCPSANLYNTLGLLEMKADHEKKAREYFRKALKAPLDRTSAVHNLEILEGSSRGTNSTSNKSIPSISSK